MKNIGFSGKELELIKNIYAKTQCAVKINDNTTEFFPFTKGVRQGCTLSPVLFNVYVNDIFNRINENNLSNLNLLDTQVNALMYADDQILLSESKDGLQKIIDKVTDFCMERNRTVN